MSQQLDGENDQGRQTLHVSFEGVVTQSLYDSFGRLSQQRFFASESAYNGGAGTPGEVWTYKYDPFGRQTEVRQEPAGQPARIATMQYDAEGRLTVRARPKASLLTRTTASAASRPPRSSRPAPIRRLPRPSASPATPTTR